MDARTFIDALQAVEARGDIDRMAALYDDGAELHNPTAVEQHRGPEGAARFWRAYREAFGEIRSEFRCIVEGDGAAALEWTSTGTLVNGDPVRYDGVTMIEWEGDRLRRFHAYFDPNALTVRREV